MISTGWITFKSRWANYNLTSAAPPKTSITSQRSSWDLADAGCSADLLSSTHPSTAFETFEMDENYHWPEDFFRCCWTTFVLGMGLETQVRNRVAISNWACTCDWFWKFDKFQSLSVPRYSNYITRNTETCQKGRSRVSIVNAWGSSRRRSSGVRGTARILQQQDGASLCEEYLHLLWSPPIASQ